MTNWLIEDAPGDAFALMLMIGTFAICKLFGILPVFIVLVLLGLFWVISLGLLITVSRWREKENSKREVFDRPHES